MNKQTKDLVVNYINDTLRYGVSVNAYEILSHLMKENRDMAAALCDVYENLEMRDGVYITGIEAYEL